MATDIAFALALLNVLGNRVPLSLKIFLTAFAIVDDLAAVMVIAIFYSANIDITLLLVALALLSVLYFLSFKGFYSKFLLLGFGIIVWVLFLKSGIHPTLAGVLLAFAVPVRQHVINSEFVENLTSITDRIKASSELDQPILSSDQIQNIDELEDWTDKYQSPLQHLEHKLHSWVAYFIIPIFALANAGVAISSDVTLETALIINIVIALVLGKSIGVSGIVILVKKLKIIDVPKDITYKHIVGVSFLAGIGFTMAIFIASLAFAKSPQYIDSAKIGILIGSVISAILGYVILSMGTKAKK